MTKLNNFKGNLSEDGCYLTLEDGTVFEKQKPGLASLELKEEELPNGEWEKMWKIIDEAVKVGGYVNRQEFLRHIVREVVNGERYRTLLDE